MLVPAQQQQYQINRYVRSSTSTRRGDWQFDGVVHRRIAEPEGDED
jgi:hypothetical protein